MLPAPVVEATFWPNARTILHFVGVCGAGKTTLSERLASRCRRHGGRAVGTLDWDPHVPDKERIQERAFRRDLDLALSNGGTPDLHRQVVDHSCRLIEEWKRSKPNLIVIDRWYESYDNLPQWCGDEIEAALLKSGFEVKVVFLTVGSDDNQETMLDRIVLTRNHRPASWWESGPETAEEWAEEECRCQSTYRRFLRRSPFSSITIPTLDSRWDDYEDQIVQSFLFSERWRHITTQDALSALGALVSPSSMS